MKLLPQNIENLLYNNINKDEEIIYETDLFIVLKDTKHTLESYHYTAWCKNDIKSLLEINKSLLENINKIKSKLIKDNIIKDNGKVFIHFPPSFWRLHIHFVDSEHEFIADEDQVFLLDYVINQINLNEDYFINNVKIPKL